MGSLALDMNEREKLDEKWKHAESFVCNDSSVGITLHSDNVTGVDGFCPEVTGLYFGLYCSDLHRFADEDHQQANRSILKSEGITDDDPRMNWSLVIPKYYMQCKELSLYSEFSKSTYRSRKKVRGTISTKLRWKIFRRDDFTCQYCGARGDADAPLQVDHKVSLANGGSDEPNNLVTSCAKCNGGKGAESINAK